MARRRGPKHRDALKLPYEVYLEANGGVELCGICGRPPKTRRLHRDHDHRSGEPRGLLCFPCNRIIAYYSTIEWFENALHYLRKALTDGPKARAKYEAGELELPTDKPAG